MKKHNFQVKELVHGEERMMKDNFLYLFTTNHTNSSSTKFWCWTSTKSCMEFGAVFVWLVVKKPLRLCAFARGIEEECFS